MTCKVIQLVGGEEGSQTLFFLTLSPHCIMSCTNSCISKKTFLYYQVLANSHRPCPACHLFVQIKLYWNTAMLICLLTVYGCFLATMAELSSCIRVALTSDPSQKTFANLCCISSLTEILFFCLFPLFLHQTLLSKVEESGVGQGIMGKKKEEEKS